VNVYTVMCKHCDFEHEEMWSEGNYMGERRDAADALEKHIQTVHPELRETLT